MVKDVASLLMTTEAMFAEAPKKKPAPLRGSMPPDLDDYDYRSSPSHLFQGACANRPPFSHRKRSKRSFLALQMGHTPGASSLAHK